MRSLLTVTAAASDLTVTTVARFKTDLNISGTASDAAIEDLIADISAAVASYIGMTLAKETVSEEFRLDRAEVTETVLLSRLPVVSIASVTEDDVALTADEYEIDKATGQLYRLSSSDHRRPWIFAKKLTVVYDAGYVMRETTNTDLPKDIELGALAWMRDVWFARRRDPNVKSVQVPGVLTQEYWVGALPGATAPIPDEAARFLDPYRRLGP